MSENTELTKHPETSKTVTTQVDNFFQQWNQWKKIGGELLKSGFLPAIFKTPEQVVAVMLKGKELNLPPMEALQRLVPINGRIGMEGQLMIALAERSGQLKALNIRFDGAGRELTCYVTVTRNEREPYTSSFSVQDATDAGLMTKDIYKKYLRDMLQWRAIARNFRITFSDILSGVYLPEELENLSPAEEAEYEEVFNEEYEYRRLHESLIEYSKQPTQDTMEAWMNLNKDSLEKLSEKKQSILKRMYESTLSRVKKGVPDGGTTRVDGFSGGQTEGGESQ